VVELLRCLYANHWKELSTEMDYSSALQRWCDVWVLPVLQLIVTSSDDSTLRARLSDVWRVTCCVLLLLFICCYYEVRIVHKCKQAPQLHLISCLQFIL